MKNAASPTLAKPCDRVALCNEVHSEKANDSIVLSVLGNVTDFNPAAESNAYIAISVTPSGIT